MGGKFKRRGRGRAGDRRGERDNSNTGGDGDAQQGAYSTAVDPAGAARFGAYYAAQALFGGDAAERARFGEALRRPLPSTFRVTGNRRVADEVVKFMERAHFSRLQRPIAFEDEVINPPCVLPWYPGGMGWMLDCSRRALRKCPEIASFHRYLVAETAVGNISRQEAVSMVPVLLLDVKPDQFVLDMCAAPGSKTAQILEAVQIDDSPSSGGLVIANDADNKRCYTLVHQLKRIQSPCFLVTNHDAGMFPHLVYNEQSLRFDRILCDVPCSGDGTIRKNFGIWGSWQVGGGNGLHPAQLRILSRGCQLLKVGGRIVYSTCSFNPIENEAVVAELLRTSGGSVRLVDVSAELPALKRRKGMLTWKVFGSQDTSYDSYDAVPDALKGKQVHASMFPPANAKELGLEKCIRIVPHDQNTGGFFVAVLEKYAPSSNTDRRIQVLADEARDGPVKKHKTDDSAAPAPGGKVHAQVHPRNTAKLGFQEDPFLFPAEDADYIKSIRDFFKFDAGKFPIDQLIIRSDTARSIYLVSKPVRQILQENSSRLKTINTGIRLMLRTDKNEPSKCSYRLSSEGLSGIVPYMARGPGSRIVELRDPEDFVKLFQFGYPMTTMMSADLVSQLESMDVGCCVFIFRPDKQNQDICIESEVLLAVRRGHKSLNLLLNKQDRQSLYMRLTGKELVHADVDNSLVKDKANDEQDTEGQGEGEDMALAED